MKLTVYWNFFNFVAFPVFCEKFTGTTPGWQQPGFFMSGKLSQLSQSRLLLTCYLLATFRGKLYGFLYVQENVQPGQNPYKTRIAHMLV